MVDYHLKVEEGVTNATLNKFCDDRKYLLHLPRLLHDFAQQYQTSGAEKAMDHLNIFNLKTLNACKYVSSDATL